MLRGSGSSTDVASEHIGGGGALPECVMARLITFNFGIMQDMLQAGPWKKKHEEKFVGLMELFTQEYEADLVFGCEVGAHKQGFAGDIYRQPPPTLKAMTLQNYLVALNGTNLPM